METLTAAEFTLMIKGLASAADYHKVQALSAAPKATAGKSTDTIWRAIGDEEAEREWACTRAMRVLQDFEVRILNAMSGNGSVVSIDAQRGDRNTGRELR